jgi:hypothetical protein
MAEDENVLLPASQAWHASGETPENLEIDLQLGGYRLRGVVREVFADLQSFLMEWMLWFAYTWCRRRRPRRG